MLKKILLVPAGGVSLPGLLLMPDRAKAMVIFCNAPGNSPRNHLVAAGLYQAGFGSLLLDLLTAEEARDYQLRYDIRSLADRLVAVTRWIKEDRGGAGRPIAYFGTGIGAAAAILASVTLPWVCAVISRGGRPDLAVDSLLTVNTPVLLLAGSRDRHALKLNWASLQALPGVKKLQVIEGAGHLFEEEGKLQEVCDHTIAWLMENLPAGKKIVNHV